MSPSPQAANQGWLSLRRGQSTFLIPASWVRRIGVIERPSPIPLAEKWVLGLSPAEHGRWLPVVDPLVAVGGSAPRHAVAALLVDPADAEALAWCLCDGPGVLVGPPDNAACKPHPILPWLVQLSSSDTIPTWRVDTVAWASNIKLESAR